MSSSSPSSDAGASVLSGQAPAPNLAGATLLMVGVGGLGCAAAAALAGVNFDKLILIDEDVVDESNLHRQILYQDGDVGRSKLEAAADALCARGMTRRQIELRPGRFLPGNARQWVRDVDVVLEGADNYATKFLVADACRLEQRSVVHGAAVGWRATVLSVQPQGAPCYRCVFEDIPMGPAHNCDSAGVMGPVVGVAGALMAEHALRALSGHPFRSLVHTFDGRSSRLRPVAIQARGSCPLCGPHASISDVSDGRYLGVPGHLTRPSDTPFNPPLS